MKIALDTGQNAYLIKACAADHIVVVGPAARDPESALAGPAERILNASVIVSPARILAQWAAPPAGAVDLPALEPALDLDPEVMLLGTGARLRWPVAGLARAVNARGVGFEVMDTATACRTYNVLALEGRRVVAALILA